MKFDYTEKEIKKVTNFYLKTFYFKNDDIFNHKKPKDNIIYFFSGQPGSGKSQLVFEIEKKNPNIYYNSILINPDEIKKYSLKILNSLENISEEQKKDIHNFLMEFSSEVENKLLDFAFDKKINIINDRDFGTDLKYNDFYFKLMKKAKKKGYKIHLYGLAVNPKISILGNFFRYFSGQENRLVPLKIHNQRYSNIIKNLKQLIYKEKLVDKFVLFKRNYEKVGILKLDSYNSKIQSFKFLKDFMIERTRELNSKEKTKLNIVYKKIKLDIMKKYNGDDELKNNNLKKLDASLKFAKTLITNEKRDLKRYFKL